MTKHNLHNNPHLIYNIDESALQTEHSPGKIVHDVVVKPQCVTSPRSSNVTIIGAGNAIGNAIPPYYIFPGVKFDRSLLLDGTPPGSDGQCSKTGWSNSEVFKTYLEKHFLKYVCHEKSGNTLLILFDGHRSHISLTLQQWAESKNIILFILPPHCSHILQPLDIGCFGPLKACYNREAQLYMRKNPGCKITKFNIGQLSCSAYQKGLSPHNLTSSFKKSGIYPFNPKAIDTSELAPATIYHKEMNDDNILGETEAAFNPMPGITNSTTNLTIQQFEILSTQNGNEIQSDDDESNSHPLLVPPENFDPIYTAEPLIELNTSNKSTTQCNQTTDTESNNLSGFLRKRSIISVVKTEKKRNQFMLTGNLGKKKNINYLKQSKQKIKFKPPFKSTEPNHVEKCKKDTETKKKSPAKRKLNTCTELVKAEKHLILSEDAQAAGLGTSGINKKGGPICINDSMSDSDLTDDDDNDLCCICNQKSPNEIHQMNGIVFVKWAQCDNENCRHWTHLQFCSDVRVLRRGDTFLCPHCKDKQ